MVVQMVYDGATYDLPKYTLDIQKQMDEINKESDFEQKVIKMGDFIAFVFGSDFANAKLGEKLEDIDLIELRNIYHGIDQTYANAMRESDTDLDDAAAAIEKLGGIDNVIKLLDAVNK